MSAVFNEPGVELLYYVGPIKELCKPIGCPTRLAHGVLASQFLHFNVDRCQEQPLILYFPTTKQSHVKELDAPVVTVTVVPEIEHFAEIAISGGVEDASKET